MSTTSFRSPAVKAAVRAVRQGTPVREAARIHTVARSSVQRALRRTGVLPAGSPQDAKSGVGVGANSRDVEKRLLQGSAASRAAVWQAMLQDVVTRNLEKSSVAGITSLNFP